MIFPLFRRGPGGTGHTGFMLSHRTALSAALLTVTLALGSAVAGCSDSDGSAGSGRTTAAYTASRTDSGTPTDADMRVTADRLRERAQTLGFKDTDVRVKGTVVTVEGPRDDADGLRQITGTARLEFRPVLDPAAAGRNGLKQAYDSLDCDDTRQAAPPAQPDGPTLGCDPQTQQKYLLGPTALDGTQVKSASARLDSVRGDGWLVDLAFSPAGSTTFAQVTGTLAQHTASANQFAILVDGHVMSAPAVVSAITGGEAQISGRFVKEDAQSLAAAISSGALPVRLEAESTS